MAHADYNCCAICDSKMEYNAYEAKTKEQICVECIERTIEHGKPMTRPEQVIEHLATLTDQQVLEWLENVDFCDCYYQNPIDEYVKSRGWPSRRDAAFKRIAEA